MVTYIIRRLMLALITWWVVVTIVFFSVRMLPGDTVDVILAQQAHLTPVTKAEIRHRLGIDLPIHVQYEKWMRGVIRGDLGGSLWTGASVTEDIIKRFPVSLELGLIAIFVALIISLPVGIFSAVRQDTVGDYVARSAAIACITIPGFWLGTMVMVIPSSFWGWAPPGEYVPFLRDPLRNLVQFSIPGVILGMFLSGITMRMTRTMMLEVLRQDYIRTAWAKGLREKVVIARHAVKNALIPVVTIIGAQIPILIGGEIIMEQIFSLPGIGLFTIQVINVRDYNQLVGINVFVASLVLIINLIVDLSYGILDPRVKYD